MKAALINNLHVDHLGFYYISAVAHRCGWDARLFLTSRSLEQELSDWRPDIICFTATTGNHGWVITLANELKRKHPRARFILGGPHATFYPEVAQCGAFDYVVRGEGEDTFAALLTTIAAGNEPGPIPGALYRDGDTVLDGGLRIAPQELDALPFPDRSLYDRYPGLSAQQYPLMSSSRGCPFSCTFCYSPTMMAMNKGLGKFVRFRSVDNVVEEALILRRKYNPRIVEFVDDIFGMHRPWLREFADKWQRHVGLPFNICVRADLLDEESVHLLARAGCNAACVGLEAGNDRIRNDVLRKELPRERLVTAAGLLRHHGIRFVTLNILGSPGETVENCLETLELNQQLKPDYAQASVLVPFPRTGIYEKAVAAGQIAEDIPVDNFSFSFFERTPLQRDDLGGILNLQRTMGLAVKAPFLNPVIRRLARMSEIKPLVWVFYLSHFMFYLRVKRIQARYLVRLGMGVKEVLRRHRAGVYSHLLPRDDNRPENPVITDAA